MYRENTSRRFQRLKPCGTRSSSLAEQMAQGAGELTDKHEANSARLSPYTPYAKEVPELEMLWLY